MRAVLFSLALFISPASSAAAIDCENGATNMAEVRACASDDQDDKLAATFSRTLAHVRARDPQAAKLLIAAQRSWEAFASTSCEYTVAARQTDLMANDARLACWQAFIDARMRILEAYQREFGKTP